MASRRRIDLRDERGISLFGEWLAWVPILCIVGLLVWQALLYAWAGTAASNAARTASRVAGEGGNGVAAGRRALDQGLRDDARVQMVGETAIVEIEVPLLIKAWGSPLSITRKATLPGGL